MVRRWNLTWENKVNFSSKILTCGHCGVQIASKEGFHAKTSSGKHAYICLCHLCNNPNYFDPSGNQFPGPMVGRDIEHIDNEQVRNMYGEARRCISSSCYTAAVLCSRKLIMNIAVAKGARPNQKFAEYVQYLSEKGYVPPDGKDWVDHIRKKGNEATHEIADMTLDDAQELLVFLEMLLIFLYEFPAIHRKITSSSTPPPSP